MVHDAYQAWDAVWEDIGEKHYAETGTLVTSRTGEGWATESLTALNEANIPLTLLSPHQLSNYLPLIDMQDVQLAYYLASGGALFAKRIVASLKNYLLTQGVQLHEQTTISQINGGLIQTAFGKTYTADHTIITAGPWARDIIPTLPVVPSQQTVYYLDVPKADLPAWQNAPMVLDIDPGSGFYLIPPVAGLGLKVGDHRFTLQGHPDTPEPHPPNPTLPLFPYPIAEAKTCFYTVALNEEFIYNEFGKVHVLTGFSGHGFKFGPLIGHRFAEVVTGELDGGRFAGWLSGH